MTLAARLCSRIEELQITQEELALISKVNESIVTRLCDGKAKGTKHIAKLARALRVRLEWLESGIGPKEIQRTLASMYDEMNKKESKMETGKKEFFSDLRQEDLIRFFNSFQIPCPVCKGEKWEVTSPSQPTLLVTLSPEGEFVIPPDRIEAHGAICSHCGYIRLHAHVIVKEWLNANPE